MYALVQAAKGLTPEADKVRVNLAAFVSDGEEVYVPRVGEPFPDGLNDGGPGKININTANITTLTTLLSIDSATAHKIVAYRQAHGPYTSIEQLLLIPISQAIYDKIKELWIQFNFGLQHFASPARKRGGKVSS